MFGRWGSWGLTAGVVTIVSVALSCANPASTGPPPTDFELEEVFGGLVAPTNVEFAPDGRVFVAEKPGTIKTFDDIEDGVPVEAADLSASVHNFGDMGLLALEVDPQYATTRPYLYALYTEDAAGLWGDFCNASPFAGITGCRANARVVRLTMDDDGLMLPGSEHVLVEDRFCVLFAHTIGDLEFLPDGSLLVSAGDGASFTGVDYGQSPGNGPNSPANHCVDPPGPEGQPLSAPLAEGGALRAQDVLTPNDPTSYDGSILRIDPDSGEAAAGNPLESTAVLDDDPIIAHGLRNPFRFTVEPGTGDVWLGDVGSNTWEEINRITDPTDATVENFGWPCYEGNGRQPFYEAVSLNLCTGLYNGSIESSITPPYFAYRHGSPPDPARCGGSGGSSISGLAFNADDEYPARLDDALFFADYNRRCVWAMRRGPGGQLDPASIETIASGTSAVELEVGPSGALYLVDIGAGKVRRVVSA